MNRAALRRPILFLASAASLALVACSSEGGSPDVAPWSKNLHTSQGNVVAATSAEGEIALAGWFIKSAHLGGDLLKAKDDFDQQTYFGRLDAEGTARWTATGGHDQESIYGVAFDSFGGTLATGSFGGEIDLGLGTITALSQDTFLARFDEVGNTSWVRHFSADLGGPSGFGSSTVLAGVAATGDGGAVIAGSFTGTLGFGGAPLDAVEEGTFIARLGAAGEHLWSRTLGGTNNDATAVAIDPEGSVLVLGATNSGQVDPAPAPGGAGFYDSAAYLVKLGPDGSVRWGTRIASDASGGYVYALALATDAAGNVIVGGVATGVVSVGKSTLDTDLGGTVPFAAMFSPEGKGRWITKLDVTSSDVASVVVDEQGHIYVAATTSVGGVDPIASIFRLDSEGQATRQWKLGERSSTITSMKALGTDLLIGGTFLGSIDLGGDELRSESGDVFLARFRP